MPRAPARLLFCEKRSGETGKAAVCSDEGATGMPGPTAEATKAPLHCRKEVSPSVSVSSLDAAQGFGDTDESLFGYPKVLVASRLPPITDLLPADAPFRQVKVKFAVALEPSGQAQVFSVNARRSPTLGKARRNPSVFQTPTWNTKRYIVQHDRSGRQTQASV